MPLVNFANRPTRRCEHRSKEGSLFGSMDLFPPRGSLALLVLVALRQHCTIRRVLMLPHVFSIGEAGKGKLECD
jgi:hypothetical protein